MSLKIQKTVGSLLLAVFFIVDRLIKHFFYLSDWSWQSGGFFSLKKTLNYGISFGWPMPLFLIMAIYLIAFVGLIGLLVFYLQKKVLAGSFLAGLILIGAISNFLDRLNIGAVMDYFDLRYFSVFNLSDVFISIGVLGFLLVYFREARPLAEK